MFKDYARNMSRKIYDSKQEGKGLKILSFLNEIRQVVYCLYQSKEITKKVYNNILKSIKV